MITATSPKIQTKLCAIYTRKSTDENLNTEFSSIDSHYGTNRNLRKSSSVADAKESSGKGRFWANRFPLRKRRSRDLPTSKFY